MNLPSKIEKLVKEITEKSPDYSESQVWATAWSVYCKHVKPGDTHCSMGPEGYLTKDAALLTLRNLAHQYPGTRKHIVPFIRSASLADKVDLGWRSRNRTAFNKFNAPELVSQLLAVLEQEGLKDTLNQIKMKKVPELVEKAWATRNPKTKSASPKNPHIPQEAMAQAESFHRQLDSLYTAMLGMASKMKSLWYATETAQSEAQQEWANSGKHPDDFNDRHLSPDGVLHEQAVQWCEDFSRMLDPRDSHSMTRDIHNWSDMLDEMVHKY